MRIIAKPEVFEFLKGYLADKEGMAVRVKLADACCGMIEPEISYDIQNENDKVYEFEGVNFIINKDVDLLINVIRLEKTLTGVDIERDELIDCPLR